MADPLKINIDFKCIHDGKGGRININIDSWKTKSVKDIKIALQDELKTPRCDQKLIYRRQVLGDDLPLPDLYLRENDTVQVEYLASGDIAGMNELITDLKEFAEAISDDPAKHEQILKIKEEVHEDGSGYLSSPISKYDLVLRSLENLAFVFFVPWKNPSTVVQRHYFVQEGGFDAFLRVFTFSHKKYKIDYVAKPKTKGSSWFNTRRKEERSEIERDLAHYNNEQMVLEMHCLSLLWNFSETSEDRKHAMRCGSLYKVMDAMLLDPHVVVPDDDEFWVIVSLNETAVGCLVQYAEFPSTQEIITNNKEIVSKLITMVECRLIRETTFFSLYSSQIAANTLFCCACSIRSPVPLVENGFHTRMIELTRRLLDNDHDLALRYYCCLFLARLTCCPMISLASETIQDIDCLLERFLATHKPEQVSDFEEKHNYVWVTMVPYVGLAFAGGSNTRMTVQLGNTAVSGVGITASATPDSLVDEEHESKEDTPQVPWNLEGIQRALTQENSAAISTPPGEQQLSRRLPGSLATQHIGLFCLKHMLSSSQNRLILNKERLAPYLFCLRWHLNQSEKDHLDKLLQKFPCTEPPSLVVISKTVLALLKGFEVILNM